MRSEAVFVLQELTRITLASDLYTKIVKSSSSTAGRRRSDALDPPQALATEILERILCLLNDDYINENVYQPTTTWERFLAFFNRGPPCLGKYYYLYGLLDCATQLGRILENSMVPRSFAERMREIVQRSRDPSLRWKAVRIYSLLIYTSCC